MQMISRYTKKIKRIAELKHKEQTIGLTFDEEAELERLQDFVEVMSSRIPEEEE